MTLNIEIYIQYEITERIKLFLLLNNIRENIKDYDKKENEKKSIVNHWDTIDKKRERVRKPRIRISKRIMNILERQEQKKE